MSMEQRRAFVKLLYKAGWFLGLIKIFFPWGPRMSISDEKHKKIFKGADLSELVRTDPATIDISELDSTPLNGFETMGLEDWEADLKSWRLEIGGNVERPFELSYQEILELPIIERKVLLTCPGFFSQIGLWTGVSIGELFKKAGLYEGVKWVTISGPKGNYKKTARFPVADALNDKILLAYGVNGVKLPQKHGFPLRLVAEGVYADDWIKYVDKVSADL